MQPLQILSVLLSALVKGGGVSHMRDFFLMKIAFFRCGASSSNINIVRKFLSSSNFQGILKLYNWSKITPILQQVEFALYIFSNVLYNLGDFANQPTVHSGGVRRTVAVAVAVTSDR